MKFSKLFPILPFCLFLGNVSAQEQEPPVLNQNPAGYSLDWAGIDKRTYFIQWSTTLNSWEFFPTIRSGDGTAISHGFNSTASKFFVRLKWTDADDGGDPNTADFDGDGLTNIQEISNVLQTSPFLWDTDNDSYNDKWEIDFGFDPQVESLGIQAPTSDIEGDLLVNYMESLIGSNPNVEYEVLLPSSDQVFTPN